MARTRKLLWQWSWKSFEEDDFYSIIQLKFSILVFNNVLLEFNRHFAVFRDLLIQPLISK